MKRLRDGEHAAADSIRIQQVLARKGWDVSLVEAEQLWIERSNYLSAGWLILPSRDEELFETLLDYLKDG